MCKSTWSEYTAYTVLDSCHNSTIAMLVSTSSSWRSALTRATASLPALWSSTNVHVSTYHGHHLEDETLLYVKTVMNTERHKCWCCVQVHRAYLIKRTAANAHTTCSQTIFLQIVQSVATNPVIQTSTISFTWSWCFRHPAGPQGWKSEGSPKIQREREREREIISMYTGENHPLPKKKKKRNHNHFFTCLLCLWLHEKKKENLSEVHCKGKLNTLNCT